jgi:hypothetical protein
VETGVDAGLRRHDVEIMRTPPPTLNVIPT